jgi:4-amino-4-deoxy-L-arabinose transferase-like glycosyltransferase
MSSQTPHVSSERLSRFPLPAAFVLLLTVCLALVWSHFRLMRNDEFLSFYTDGVASFKDVVRVQLHYPISLDPPTYHLLSHLSMDLIGRNALALRLPALAGFLLLEVCLFIFVRRLAGERAAVIAMAVPMLTACFQYATEGRPYGLLLGLYAASLVCWQAATMDDGVERSRLLPLAGLTLSIALAITSHYFGVLILIPVSLGELARIVSRKRLDYGVLAALALGMGAVVLVLPFQKAVLVYQRHYYALEVSGRNISQGYRELFLRYSTWPMAQQKLAALLMVIGVVALAVAGYRRYQARRTTEHAYVWVAIVAMALLPLFGFLFGRFITHTMSVKYIVAALIAFAAVFGIVLEKRLRSNSFYYGLLAVIVVAALGINVNNIVRERREMQAVFASFQMSPAVAEALQKNPSAPIYVQTLENFYMDTYYEPDAALRSRFSMIYDQNNEIKWLHHDTNYVTAVNMAHFTPLSIAPYDGFLKQEHPLLLLDDSGWQWIGKEIGAEHLAQTRVGSWHGELVTVATPAAR